MADWNECMWNLALQPLKTSYLHFHKTYHHQNRQGGVLPWEVLIHKITWPFDYVVFQGHVTKKLLYLYYQSAYGHQTWQDGNLTWRAPTHKVKQRLDHMVLQVHVTSKSHYTSTTRVLMATKLGSMMTYLDGLLPIKSHDPVISWLCEISWPTKTIYLQYHSAYGHQIW